MTTKAITKAEFIEALRVWNADAVFSEQSFTEEDALSEALNDTSAIEVLTVGVRQCLEEKLCGVALDKIPGELVIGSSIIAGMKFGMDVMKKIYETRELERMADASVK